MPAKKEILILVLAGVAAGLFLTFYAAGLFVFLFFLCCLLLIKIFIKTGSRDFLIKLFIISFILRALFCVINYNVGLRQPFQGGDTQPDAAVYSGNAFYISHLLKGDTAEDRSAMAENPFLTKRIEIEGFFYKNKLPPVDEYQFGRYIFLLGTFYAWLGYAPVAAKMINSLFCCMSIVIVYLIARQLFKEERPSRYAAAIFAFFPSIFYWSITGLRDTVFNFFILGYLLCMVKFMTKKNYLYALFAVFFIYFSNSFRASTSIPLLAGFGAVLIINILTVIKARGSRFLKIILVLSVCFVLGVLILHKTVIISKIVNVANLIARANLGLSASGRIPQSWQTNYIIYSDLVYQQRELTAGDIFSFGYLVTIFKAIFYFFFLPFPFGNWTLNFLPFYPQIIYWYLMTPFVIKGWLLFLKKDKYTALALLVLLLIVILPMALYESNIGTAFRHKDMFLPIAFVFAAYAFTRQQTGNGRS